MSAATATGVVVVPPYASAPSEGKAQAKPTKNRFLVLFEQHLPPTIFDALNRNNMLSTEMGLEIGYHSHFTPLQSLSAKAEATGIVVHTDNRKLSIMDLFRGKKWVRANQAVSDSEWETTYHGADIKAVVAKAKGLQAKPPKSSALEAEERVLGAIRTICLERKVSFIPTPATPVAVPAATAAGGAVKASPQPSAPAYSELDPNAPPGGAPLSSSATSLSPQSNG